MRERKIFKTGLVLRWKLRGVGKRVLGLYRIQWKLDNQEFWDFDYLTLFSIQWLPKRWLLINVGAPES
jgi:hypothetical protein